MELQSSHQLVRRFAQHIPLDLFPFHLRNGDIEDPHLALHGADISYDVVRIRFIDGSKRDLLRRDSQFRVAFIAEEVDVRCDPLPSLWTLVFRFSSMSGLLISVTLLASRKSLYFRGPPNGPIGRIVAFRQQGFRLHLQDPYLRIFGAARRDPMATKTVKRWNDCLDGRYDACFVHDRIE